MTERIGTGILFDLSIVDLDRTVLVVFRCQETLDQAKVHEIHRQMEGLFEHRMKDGTLTIAVLDRGADVNGLGDDELAELGLQRIPK